MTGKRVLVVEDEAIIAIQVEDELERAGCEVVGPASSVGKALQLIAREPLDVAVLDYRLGADTSREIAATLRARHIPFLFMTGNTSTDLPRDLRDVPCLEKPVRHDTLMAALEAAVKFR
ncbi:MAG: response regulator [Beijerinckiaceae bacterium]|nr:response regulator [Beijerinckiaceae bacterium]